MNKNTFIIPSIMAVSISLTGCMSTTADQRSAKVFSVRSQPQSVKETNATLTPLPVNVVPSMAQNPLADAGLIYEESKVATPIKSTPVDSETTKKTTIKPAVGAKEIDAILVSDNSSDPKAKVDKADRVMTLTNKNVIKAKKTKTDLAKEVAKKKADALVAKAEADAKKQAKEVVSRPASIIRNNSQLVSNEMAKAKESASKAKENANKAKENANKAKESAKKVKEKIKEKTKEKTKIKPVAKKTIASAKKKLPTSELLKEARKAIKSKNFEKAANALERAHRIQPKNAKILYDIAQIRYAQGKYSQAESFASKAANNSSATLAKKSWTILSKARKAMGNTLGAKTAAKKAASY